MRSTQRCLGLDGPGPSGFNERIHKKQVLPYIGSSQNYLSPCVSSEPNFNLTNSFGILVFKGSFFNVLSQENKCFSTKSPCKENINWNHPNSSPVSCDVHPGFKIPNDYQINMPTILLGHQLHNQIKYPVDSVLAQPFATLMNAITEKRLNQTEDMD